MARRFRVETSTGYHGLRWVIMLADDYIAWFDIESRAHDVCTLLNQHWT